MKVEVETESENTISQFRRKKNSWFDECILDDYDDDQEASIWWINSSILDRHGIQTVGRNISLVTNRCRINQRRVPNLSPKKIDMWPGSSWCFGHSVYSFISCEDASSAFGVKAKANRKFLLDDKS